MDLFSEDGIAFMALDIVIDGDDFGEEFSHFGDPEVGERSFPEAVTMTAMPSP